MEKKKQTADLLIWCWIIILICLSAFAQAQGTFTREQKKNLVMKEWNADANGKRAWMDRVTTYNGAGYKIEEIEYASYGQKFKNTYEYNQNNQCIKEMNYDGKNRLQRVIKYTYLADGRHDKQYNYLANGKLYSIKRFEYIEAEK